MLEFEFKTLPQIMKKNSEIYPDKPAFRFKRKGKWEDITFKQFYIKVMMAARGLMRLGVKQGDKIAILSENRPFWAEADFAILSIGAINVPIYPTSTPEQIKYILNHSEAKVLFVSNRTQYNKIFQIKDELKFLERVVTFDRFLTHKIFPADSMLQLMEISEDLDPVDEAAIENVYSNMDTEEVATIIYTSGTTGTPKGVLLTHYNFISEIILGTKKIPEVNKDDIFLSFLPLSHVLERAVGYYIPFYRGATIAYAESIEKVPDNLVEIKPTAMVSVPRLFEKMYSRIFENIHSMPSFKKNLIHAGIKVSQEYVHKKYIEGKRDNFLRMKRKFFDRLIFSKIRERLGGKIRYCVSGGAPLDKTINEFFWAIGVPIFEGYGLTETSPGVCINNFTHIRFGSVGTLFEETYAKLGEQDELLLKGPMVTKLGYFKNEEATKEAFTEDGWFKTGDVGRIDEDGFIYIVDRLKELIITSGGKNIAPQPIENELKLDKYISNAFVYGDKKPYLTAVIVPNFERLYEFTRENKLNYLDASDLVTKEEILKLYQSRIDEVNKKLAKYETIKKFVLVPVEFTIDGGELTPTLKLKRRVIYEKYKDKIECLYDENGDCFTCT
jgi:long-chain acyl-CoA synthetase